MSAGYYLVFTVPRIYCSAALRLGHGETKNMKTARLLAGLAVLLCAASAQAATPVSSYPDRPIRVIVPFGPGTGTDILARTLTEDLRAGLGWNFVVDNRAGGSAQIAAELAAKAASRRLHGIPQHQHPALREPLPVQENQLRSDQGLCRGLPHHPLRLHPGGEPELQDRHRSRAARVREGPPGARLPTRSATAPGR